MLTEASVAVGPYEVREIGLNRASELAWLAHEDVRDLLAPDGQAEGLVLVAAMLLGRPVGLAVASISGTDAELLDLHVAPAHRGAGLGRALLARSEELVGASGRAAIVAHTQIDQHTPAFERLLVANGWRLTKEWRRFTGDFPGTTNHWWHHERHQVPAGLELTPWAALDESERAGLRARGAAGWYPAWVSPFEDLVAPGLIDPVSSLVLRRGGDIVGFVVCQRWSREVAYVASVFVGPELRGAGLRRTSVGTGLIGEAVKCMIADGATHVVLDVDTWNRGMLHWANRFVLDSSPPSTVREWRRWQKQLAPAG